MNHPLKVNDRIRCPQCRRWHVLVKWHTEGTPYTLQMLYFRCEGQMFYAGQEGLPSRHDVRDKPPAGSPRRGATFVRGSDQSSA